MRTDTERGFQYIKLCLRRNTVYEGKVSRSGWIPPWTKFTILCESHIDKNPTEVRIFNVLMFSEATEFNKNMYASLESFKRRDFAILSIV